VNIKRPPPKRNHARPENPPDLDYRVDFSNWLKMDTWSIYDAAFLILDIDPRMDEFFLGDISQKEKNALFEDILNVAKNCEGRSLEVVSKTNFDRYGRVTRYAIVEPQKFSQWAATKNYPVSEVLLLQVIHDHDGQKNFSIPEKRIQIVISIIEKMLKVGTFSVGDPRWPRGKVWRKAVEADPILFPNDSNDQREGVFAKAYNEARKRIVEKT
jgi:hypothetical protein